MGGHTFAPSHSENGHQMDQDTPLQDEMAHDDLREPRASGGANGEDLVPTTDTNSRDATDSLPNYAGFPSGVPGRLIGWGEDGGALGVVEDGDDRDTHRARSHVGGNGGATTVVYQALDAGAVNERVDAHGSPERVPEQIVPAQERRARPRNWKNDRRLAAQIAREEGMFVCERGNTGHRRPRKTTMQPVNIVYLVMLRDGDSVWVHEDDMRDWGDYWERCRSLASQYWFSTHGDIPFRDWALAEGHQLNGLNEQTLLPVNQRPRREGQLTLANQWWRNTRGGIRFKDWVVAEGHYNERVPAQQTPNRYTPQPGAQPRDWKENALLVNQIARAEGTFVCDRGFTPHRNTYYLVYHVMLRDGDSVWVRYSNMLSWGAYWHRCIRLADEWWVDTHGDIPFRDWALAKGHQLNGLNDQTPLPVSRPIRPIRRDRLADEWWSSTHGDTWFSDWHSQQANLTESHRPRRRGRVDSQDEEPQGHRRHVQDEVAF
jgi:hypothetical protein